MKQRRFKRRAHPAKLRAYRLVRHATHQKKLTAKRRRLWRFACTKLARTSQAQKLMAVHESDGL
ncbi:MAG: hypothetical protein Q4B81_03360 [Moraxella sp.]|nr:hypothetical protein [Moraxella sp.]